HLWSLAVEEQFYVVWPLVLVAIARRRGTIGKVAAVTGVAALATAAFGLVAYALGASPELLYYGTVTNASPLLVGATLAMVWRPARLARLAQPLRRSTVEIGAAAALAGVLVAALLLDGTGHAFYLGGQLVVSLMVAVLMALVVLPTPSVVGLVFENSIVRWVGTRSYAIYLWHWPALVLMRGSRPELAEWWIAPAAVAATFALSELSWRVVERPTRRLGTGRPTTTWTTIALGLVAASLLVCVVFVASPAKVTGQWPPREVVQAELAAKGELYGSPVTGRGTVGAGGATVDTVQAGSVTLKRPKGLVVFVGDSVLLGASAGVVDTIGEPVIVDAKVGRYSRELVSTVAELERTDRLGPTVVLHVGQNGPFTRADLRDVMRIAGEDRKVYFINSAVSRDWAEPTDDMLLHNLPDYPNARMIDWKSVSQGHAEYFVADGVHLTPDGITAFSELIRAAMFERTRAAAK
ncbi:MAG: acyltransferase, partial [Thermoleophilia bacterium]|nr:acyltransferase [Thermoleophilia bacterium]